MIIPASQNLLSIENGAFLLSGVTEATLRIDDSLQKSKQAKVNVEKAINGSKLRQNIFVGIEHFPFLFKVANQFSKPIIIIEKCSVKISEFRKSRTNVPDNFTIVSGNLGVVPPQTVSEVPQLYYYHTETAPIVLALVELNHIDYGDMVYYELPSNELEEKLDNLLRIYVLFLKKRAKWLKEKKIDFELIAASKMEGPMLLATESETRDSLKELIGQFLNQVNLVVLDQTSGNHAEFVESRAELNKTDADTMDLDEFYSTVFSNINQIVEKMKLKKPDYVLCRNFQANYCIEFSILLADVLRISQSILCFVLVDWMTLISLPYFAGWSTAYYKQIYRGVGLRLLTMYPYNEGLHLKNTGEVSFFPFNFSERCKNMTVPDESLIIRDIAVIHWTRSYVLSDTLFQKLSDFVESLNDQVDCARLFFELTNWLHKRFIQDKTCPLAGKTYWAHALEWYFYSRIKINRVRQLVDILHPQFKIELFGSFSDFISKDICRDGDYELDQIRQIYKTSLVTVDLKPMYAWCNIATVNSVHCLASGGLALCHQPVFDEYVPEDGYDFSNKSNFLTYSNPSELFDMVDYFKNNLHERDKYISNAQKSWLKALVDGKYFNPMDQLFQKKIHPTKMEFKSLMAQDDFALWLSDIVMAILTIKNGFVMAGAARLEYLLESRAYFHASLTAVVCQCYSVFGLKSKAREFAKKGLLFDQNATILTDYL